MSKCPCCSGMSFEECCRLYLQEKEYASTPEKLMRSRYTAYSLKNEAYILQTMKGKALSDYQKMSKNKSETNVRWEKLVIISAPEIASTAEEGFVEFIAYYSENGQLNKLHEKSRFVRRKGRWYYIDGKKLP